MSSRSTWHKGKTLGTGSSGSVYLAFDANRNKLAVKTARVEKSSNLVKENRILEYFRDCPEIVGLYANEITVEDGVRYYNLLLEYALGGDLLDLIDKDGGRISQESVLRRYTRMILNGLSYIHAKGIVHCDLKPENILAFPSEDGYQLKITDFGLAKEAGEAASESKKYNYRGTPDYMSPESVPPRCEIETAMDIWSLGCVVLVMFTGEEMWRATGGEVLDPEEIIRLLASTDVMPEIPKDMSEIGKDFLSKCLQRDPSKRWSAQKLLDHPYVRS